MSSPRAPIPRPTPSNCPAPPRSLSSHTSHSIIYLYAQTCDSRSLTQTMKSFRLAPRDRANLLTFLRDLVRTPSPSSEEGAVAERIVREMQRLDFADVRTDPI